jgi:hypothetical protein
MNGTSNIAIKRPHVAIIGGFVFCATSSGVFVRRCGGFDWGKANILGMHVMPYM